MAVWSTIDENTGRGPGMAGRYQKSDITLSSRWTMNLPRETLLCGGTAGAVFVRPCPEPAVLRCARCECPLCEKHGRPDPSGTVGAVLCSECYAEARREASDDADGDFGDDGGTRWSGGSGRHSSGTAYGSDGGSGMAEAEDIALADDGSSPFTDEDYAAFDAVSDYDKSADDGDGYDS
jgi:hypothetical protein